MGEITLFLVESRQAETGTELIVFSRDESGNKKFDIVSNFAPYIYVLDSEPIPDDNRITQIERGYKSIEGLNLKKIFIRHSFDVLEVRNLFTKTWEADILFTQRYIIDTEVPNKTYPLKVISVDIEIDSENVFPDIDKAENKVTSISVCDTDFKKKVFLLLPPNRETLSIDMTNIEIFKTEEDLLFRLIKYVFDEDPDIITGWNVNFDLRYLDNRMAKFNIDFNRLSPLHCTTPNTDKTDYKIKGRIVLDMMKLYKRFRQMSNQGQATSYSLENISREVLGIGKIEHTENFHELWTQNPEKLAEYNLRDSELVIEINNKLDIINFFNMIRVMTFTNFDQIFQTTAMIDGYLLHRLHNKVVLPNKNKKLNDDINYKGAFVFQPTPGLYKNVSVFDVKSLYPSLIMSFNVGYETLSEDGEIKLNDKIKFKKGIGIMSSAVRDLFGKRKELKQLMRNAKTQTEYQLYNYQQYTIKTIMNSIYGYQGYPGSRLFKKEVAEAITVWGQKTLAWAQSVLENKGYVVRYQDTDSCFFESHETEIEKIVEEGKRLVADVNESFKQFVRKFGSDDCCLEMEFEKVLGKILFLEKNNSKGEGAKKNYAYTLLWADDGKVDDKIHIKGISARRSDSAQISKRVQMKVLEMIINESPKEDIVAYLKYLDTMIRKGKIDVLELAFPKGISNNIDDYGKSVKDNTTGRIRRVGTPPVVQGAIYANKYLGQHFNKGSKPKWIYVKKSPKGFPHTNIITFEHELPDGFVPDYELLIEKNIIDKVKSLFYSAGFGELPNINTTIKTLNQFCEV